jgi:hypothetical protein
MRRCGMRTAIRPPRPRDNRGQEGRHRQGTRPLCVTAKRTGPYAGSRREGRAKGYAGSGSATSPRGQGRAGGESAPSLVPDVVELAAEGAERGDGKGGGRAGGEFRRGGSWLAALTYQVRHAYDCTPTPSYITTETHEVESLRRRNFRSCESRTDAGFVRLFASRTGAGFVSLFASSQAQGSSALLSRRLVRASRVPLAGRDQDRLSGGTPPPPRTPARGPLCGSYDSALEPPNRGSPN